MQNAIQMVKNIEDAFCEADPDNAETYKANAEAYIEKLEALDSELKLITAGGNRRDVVFGGRFAYGYFIHGMAWSMRAFMTAVRRIRSRAWHRWRM